VLVLLDEQAEVPSEGAERLERQAIVFARWTAFALRVSSPTRSMRRNESRFLQEF